MTRRERWKYVGRIGQSYWWVQTDPPAAFPAEQRRRVDELWPPKEPKL